MPKNSQQRTSFWELPFWDTNFGKICAVILRLLIAMTIALIFISVYSLVWSFILK
jgi:hypothetical protein